MMTIVDQPHYLIHRMTIYDHYGFDQQSTVVDIFSARSATLLLTQQALAASKNVQVNTIDGFPETREAMCGSKRLS